VIRSVFVDRKKDDIPGPNASDGRRRNLSKSTVLLVGDRNIVLMGDKCDWLTPAEADGSPGVDPGARSLAERTRPSHKVTREEMIAVLQ
jgi:hypothetical protein